MAASAASGAPPLLPGVVMPPGAGSVQVSESDDRAYRALTLPNGMRVLLCSDPSTDTSGAALEVSVGHFSDPAEAPGLAHFLEHLLFMGTKKYPRENEYSSFLNEHGGFSNAYTASEQTQYQFEVAKDALEGALDRFSQFFVAPLFDPSGVGRELEAVDSEHSKNLQSDTWRAYQLDKATSSTSHPYSKFGTGNSVTLRDAPAAAGFDVRAALLAMHAQHYSASRMSLALLGAEPLDTLERWAREYFSAVVDNGSAPPVFSGHPYEGGPHINAPGATGELQFCVPVKDRRELSVAWPIPPSKGDWRAKSDKYVSHLLGHEGPGSLLSTLRERGWATGLSAGETDGEAGYSTFGVSVDLSPAGLAAWECVLDAVYAAVGVLRAAGPQEWIHEEKAGLAATSFRFASKRGVFSTVSAFARSLPDFPPEAVLTGPSLVWTFDPAGVERIVARLVPANSRVRVSAKDAAVAEQCTSTERWYGVKYASAPLGAERAARLERVAAAYEALTRARAGAAGGKPPVGGAAALSPALPADAPALAAGAALNAGGEAAAAAAAAAAAGWAPAAAPAAVLALFPPLTLPAPNAFIAADFALRSPAAAAVAAAKRAGGPPRAADALPPGASLVAGVRVRREDAPRLLSAGGGAGGAPEVWLLQDETFGLPKLSVPALLELPAAYASPRAAALTELAIALAREGLTEVAYAAALAELSYSMALSTQGVSFALGGFSDKLPRLAAAVAGALPAVGAPPGAPGAFTATAFGVQLDKLARAYANDAKNPPYNHAAAGVSLATTTPRWSVAEKAAALAGAPPSPAELRAHVAAALGGARLRVLAVGNATPDEALVLAAALRAPFARAPGVAGAADSPPPPPPPPASAFGAPRVVALPAPLALARADGGTSLLCPELLFSRPGPNPDEPNAAVDVVLQLGPSSGGASAAKQSAIVDLVGHVVGEPFFDALRTKQQLGYICFGGERRELGVDGFRFLVQSNRVATGEELADRVNAFLADFAGALAGMPAATFADHVRAVSVKLAEADKNIAGLAGRVWPEVLGGHLDFTRASAGVKALAELTQDAVAAWFREVVAPGGARRRAIVSIIERGAAVPPLADKPDAAAAAAGADAPAPGDAAGDAAPAPAAPAPAPPAPAPPAPPLPVVRVPLAAAARALSALAAAAAAAPGGGAGAPTPAAAAVDALAAAAGPAAAAALAAALEGRAPAVRLVAVVGADAHADVRAFLPLWPDVGAATRAAFMADFEARAGAGGGA